MLLLARVPRPVALASFISLNPSFRLLLAKHFHPKDPREKPHALSDRTIATVANAASAILLYVASEANDRIPKDYLLLYLWISYYGALNPPSALKVLVSPKLLKYLKISTYKSPTLSYWYENKEYVIFPAIFAQILSNYLTPTRYKLNQRYLSSSIKSYLLSPIWINYTQLATAHLLRWSGLARSYILHNVCLTALFGLISFKSRFLDRYYELKHGKTLETKEQRDLPLLVLKKFLLHSLHSANALVNFLYAPNLIAILLISLTLPVLTYLRQPKAVLHSFYMNHTKTFFKSYIKIIGFAAAFTGLFFNSMDLIPAYGLKEDRGVRRVSKEFMDGVNLYLFRLILLSKWRITKENHPWFKLLRLKTWERIEAAVMCYGVFKVMNLNDFVKRNKDGESSVECLRLQKESLVKIIDRIM